MRCPKCYKELSPQGEICSCGFDFIHNSLWVVSPMDSSALSEISNLLQLKEQELEIVASWGPARPTFANEAPATYPVFNSITNNAALGDERTFVRIAERASGNCLVNNIVVEAGKQYVVSIYYHNNASSTLNDKAHNYSGIAMNVRVIASFPDSLSAGEAGLVTGKIVATNTNPKAVWSAARITTKEDIKIYYVEGSATIYNNWKTNREKLSQYLFSNEGVFIGLDELNGAIFGCDEYSGQVAYVLQTEPA